MFSLWASALIVCVSIVSVAPTFAAEREQSTDLMTSTASTPGAMSTTSPTTPNQSASPAGKDASADDAQIRSLLQKQADDWNKGDLEEFVTGYKKSEDTLFVGATGIKRGSKAILERYKSAYPDRAAMGYLAFSNLEVHVTSANSAYAIGEFKLEMSGNERRSGFFTLNLLKTNGRWEIVADHTTVQELR